MVSELLAICYTYLHSCGHEKQRPSLGQNSIGRVRQISISANSQSGLVFCLDSQRLLEPDRLPVRYFNLAVVWSCFVAGC